MTNKHALTRRQYLAATGASALALGLGARAGVRAAGDRPSGLPDQHLGHADLLPDAIGRARKARREIPGIRRAVRQPHHAADGRPPGRPRHLCRTVVPDRTRQGRPRRDRADRICRQDRAGRDPQGPEPEVRRRPQRQEGRQPGRIVGRQRVRRHDRTEIRRPQIGLPGSPDERQRHDRRHGGEDRRRHGQCRALQRDRRRRRHRRFRSSISPASTGCRC